MAKLYYLIKRMWAQTQTSILKNDVTAKNFHPWSYEAIILRKSKGWKKQSERSLEYSLLELPIPLYSS